MDVNDSLSLIFALSAALPLSLLLAFGYLRRQRRVPALLVPAALASTLWHLANVNFDQISFLTHIPLHLLEIFRNGLWISALLATIEFNNERRFSRRFKWGMHGSWLLSLCLVGGWGLWRGAVSLPPLVAVFNLWLLAITGILAAEQLVRTLRGSRMTKLLGLGIGAMFAYDAALYASMLIFQALDPAYWQVRGLISGVAAAVAFVAVTLFARQADQPSAFAMSRGAVFYSTSLTLAGSFILVMAMIGYYVRAFGGDWGGALQILVVFVALVLVLLLSVSGKSRRWLNVWTNKHFFGHKYDYRQEWLRLNRQLGRRQEGEDCYQRATRAAVAQFNAAGGGLWLRESAVYRPMALCGLTVGETLCWEPANTEFCRILGEREWVFTPDCDPTMPAGVHNPALPPWIRAIDKLWLVIPLITDDGLLGFILLLRGAGSTRIGWEDLDLMKLSGRQIASYLGHRHSAEQLAESRQFDVFNKLTAFAVHDLSNLIAKQALVVKNAEKHRHNPEFIDDALHTVSNSVTRMNALLQKLQQGVIRTDAADQADEWPVEELVAEAVAQCRTREPAPRLQCEGSRLALTAERESFVMMLVHLIRNAQDASPPEGRVEVRLSSRDHYQLIEILDTGEGMSAEFLQKRLFKPFDSTKTGSGLGIGAYQIKHLVDCLEGNIEVRSAPGEGTSFQLLLPARLVA